MHLAQVNVALLRAPLRSEEMREFIGGLRRINHLAEHSPGFVWRLQTHDQHGVSVIMQDGRLVFVNVSVWTHYEALHKFVYRSAHGGFVRRRREWFDPTPQPSTALWWVQDGEHPTLDDALRRLRHLRERGPSPRAFSLLRRFDTDGAAVRKGGSYAHHSHRS